MVKKTDGPFGKPGVEEKFSLVGAAPGISAEGEAIVEFDDNWVVLTKRGWKRSSRKGQAKVRQFTLHGMRNRTIVVTHIKLTPHGTTGTSAQHLRVTLIDL